MTVPAPSVCDLCGGALAPGQRGWLLTCQECGTLRSTLPVEIPAHVDDSPLDEALRENGLEAVRRINNARLLDAIADAAPAGRRLLDVGCGPGFLLEAARARGFEPLGLEPDANVVVAALQGELVRQGYFPSALATDERFDVIVFNDVLEHIPDLDGALAASVDHLAPGGLLVVNAPDRRGLFFRVATIADRLGLAGAHDRLWQRGLPSPHIWYMTPPALSQAARRRGLQTVVEGLRLKTVALDGLWSRIRYVKTQPLALSLAAWLFAVATLPLAWLLPADASASIYRKPQP